jgi:hypothetical protein
MIAEQKDNNQEIRDWERKAGFSFSALGFKAPALKHFCFKADLALAMALKPSSHFPILSIP